MRGAALRLVALLAAIHGGALSAATLEGIAVLPAGSVMPGPPAGQFIGAQAGVPLPFNGQPVQGISAIITADEGFLVLTDNGFGTRANSGDFVLRIYQVEVAFRTARGGAGAIRVNGFINLSDPAGYIGYPVVADTGTHVAAGRSVAVPPALRADRWLTGHDLDPESLQRAADGSLWVGDELGPYLARFDDHGELLEPLASLPRLVAHNRPRAGPPAQPAGDGERVANLPASRGFEGLARSPDGRFLYPMLEGTLDGESGHLNIYTFDTERGDFVNPHAHAPSFRYRPDPAATAIGDFQLFSQHQGLVIERDDGEGAAAAHKKVFRVDLRINDADGFLRKEPLADLLSLDDPLDLDRDGRTTFAFNHLTPEALIVLDRDTIGVVNDNNFPFGRAGRSPGPGPDGTEFILVHVAALW